MGEVWVYDGPAIPSRLSEAATVLLEPSRMSATERLGPRMNVPSAPVASPPFEPEPAQKA